MRQQTSQRPALRWRRWLSVVLQRGNAAMVLAALGKSQPELVDADLLQVPADRPRA